MNSSNVGVIQRKTAFTFSRYTYQGPIPSGPLQGIGPDQPIAISARIGDFTNTSNTFYFMDSVQKIGASKHRGCNFVFDNSGSSQTSGNPHPRHKLAVNITYADGHSSNIKLTDGEDQPAIPATREVMYGAPKGGGYDANGYTESELSDARSHDNNHWTLDGRRDETNSSL
jgi:prepilin-type processing-associated H-X9-DG protein